jgi:hypothetical protein
VYKTRTHDPKSSTENGGGEPQLYEYYLQDQVYELEQWLLIIDMQNKCQWVYKTKIIYSVAQS